MSEFYLNIVQLVTKSLYITPATCNLQKDSLTHMKMSIAFHEDFISFRKGILGIF